ncbi:MAG: DUF4350 domain-containing protein [Wenzhouxiangella sp.]
MSRERIAIALVLLGLLLGGLWWYFNAEFEDRLIVRPVSAQLNTERYFLAGRWLEQQGLVTRNQNRVDQLDGSGAGQLLLAHSPLDQYDDVALDALTQWVVRGGALIIMAPRQLTGSMDQHPLNPHGLTSQWTRRDADEACAASITEWAEAAEEAAEEATETPNPCLSWRQEPMTLDLPDGQSLRLWNQRYLVADTEPDSGDWLNDQGQRLIARYPVGAGQVTLLADNHWFSNSQLINPGHSLLLETLIPTQHFSRVLLEQRRESGSLIGWLWRLVPWLWLLLLAWLALWVWSRLPRLGPVQELTEGYSRQMREQLLATARFDWRHRKGQALIKALHEEGRQRLQRRYPDWNRLDSAQQLQRLSQLLPDIDRSELAGWLTPPRQPDAERFIDYVRLHQTVMHLL